LEQAGSVQAIPDPNWQFVTINVVADAASMIASLSRDTAQASGDLWVDDLGLRDVETGTYAVVELELTTARKE
jgi:hypothetical protein